jgi:hypothetical protein
MKAPTWRRSGAIRNPGNTPPRRRGRPCGGHAPRAGQSHAQTGCIFPVTYGDLRRPCGRERVDQPAPSGARGHSIPGGQPGDQPGGQRGQSDLETDDRHRPADTPRQQHKEILPGTIGDPVIAGSTGPSSPAKPFRMRKRSIPGRPM